MLVRKCDVCESEMDSANLQPLILPVEDYSFDIRIHVDPFQGGDVDVCMRCIMAEVKKWVTDRAEHKPTVVAPSSRVIKNRG